MKKGLKLLSTALLSSLVMSACGLATTGTGHTEYNTFDKQLTQEEVYSLIMTAGKKDGWRMTEFKNNTIIAEKTDDGDSESVTISFSDEYFSLSPENGDLEDAIEDAIEDSGSSHE